MAALPSGTVTFLFTDIEGSTALWERCQTAMATAVERHFKVLRDPVAAHACGVFKVVGDAFQPAFPTAPDAVAAALGAQRALAQEAWAEGSGPVSTNGVSGDGKFVSPAALEIRNALTRWADWR